MRVVVLLEVLKASAVLSGIGKLLVSQAHVARCTTAARVGEGTKAKDRKNKGEEKEL